MSLTWSHTFINVKNLDEMVKFYTEVLGFKVADTAEDIAFLSQLDDEHHQLAFHQIDPETSKPSQVGHFAFRVPSLKDVLGIHEMLTTAKRNKKVAPITHGNTWSIYFSDPEQNGIEVFCDTPWEVTQPFSKPWDPAMSAADLEKYTLGLVQEQGSVRPNRRLAATTATR